MKRETVTARVEIVTDGYFCNTAHPNVTPPASCAYLSFDAGGDNPECHLFYKGLFHMRTRHETRVQRCDKCLGLTEAAEK